MHNQYKYNKNNNNKILYYFNTEKVQCEHVKTCRKDKNIKLIMKNDMYMCMYSEW